MKSQYNFTFHRLHRMNFNPWYEKKTILNDLEIFTIHHRSGCALLHEWVAGNKIGEYRSYIAPWIFWVGPELASQSRYANGLRKCHSWLFKRTVTAPWLDSHCSTTLRDISPMHPANLYSYLYNLFLFDN